jgi:hypothetical protein
MARPLLARSGSVDVTTTRDKAQVEAVSLSVL